MFGYTEASGLPVDLPDSDEEKENSAPTAPPWLKKQRLSPPCPAADSTSLATAVNTEASTDVGREVAGSKRNEIIKSIRLECRHY